MMTQTWVFNRATFYKMSLYFYKMSLYFYI
nr:MAG TPA: hypothetical protein [Caudoviricetes sp.]